MPEATRSHVATQRAVWCALFAIGTLVLASSAAAQQQPTSAQRNAIRQSCRDDFIAHCSGVQPGGKAAFMCLQKNSASLAPACQQAVNAVAAGAAPAAQQAATPESKTAAPATDTSAAPAAAPPANKPQTATAPAATAPAATTATAPAAAPARPMSPRAELALIRTVCGPDFRALCGGVMPGGGRVIACLRANQASLSPRCQGALLAGR